MPKALSDNLKACIPILHTGGLQPMQIAEKLGVSLSIVHLTLWLQSKYGVPYCLSHVQLGQKCILSASSIEFIDKLLVADNTLYLDEI
ncbi:hypothetical protein BS47DRAFT_1418769 [Hydnum rufescens UP504]|uniref:Uncharacterized protein n=1 Tax=Hydnum rufescens UP504 TaxID=1448309 RepID=A0A9P6ALG1_9AGAM|nr:hypothetical protein BS47DRAFT_1418769 [Hydnum rufescens UP504]